MKIWSLLVSVGAVTVIAAMSYGIVRFRAEFEVSLVVLAGAGILAAAEGLAAAWSKRFRRLRRSTSS